MFLVKINSEICFLCLPVSRVLSWFSNIFFPEFDVRHFERSHRNRIFFLHFFAAFVAVLFPLTRTFCLCWKTFPHFLRCLNFFFSLCEFIVSGHCLFGNFFFFWVYDISFVAQSLVYGFISSNRHVSTWRGRGGTQTILNWSCICVSFSFIF